MQLPTLYVTTMEIVNQPDNLLYAPDPGGPGFRALGGVRAYGRVRLEMEMDYTDGAGAILDSIHRNRGQLTFGVERREYRCVFCGSANPLSQRHCSQCGGPRGWIL